MTLNPHLLLHNIIYYYGLSEATSLAAKILAISKIAFTISIPAFAIAELSDWTITNRSYITGVLACIAIDHVIGTFYHAFKAKDFTFKKNALGLISKLALCACAAVLFEIIHHTAKDVAFLYDYLKTITRLVVILYPAGSAFMNMSALTHGVFPPIGWIKKIKAFNQDLDMEKFKHGQSVTQQDQSAAP